MNVTTDELLTLLKGRGITEYVLLSMTNDKVRTLGARPKHGNKTLHVVVYQALLEAIGWANLVCAVILYVSYKRCIYII